MKLKTKKSQKIVKNTEETFTFIASKDEAHTIYWALRNLSYGHGPHTSRAAFILDGLRRQGLTDQ